MIDLEEIHRRYLNMIFRICSRYCRDRQEAEDLTQEAFLRIDKRLGTFRGEAELGTWIYRLATNCCLDHLRKKKSLDRLYAEYLDSMVIHNLDSEGGDRVLAKIDMDRILSHLLPRVRQILFLTLAEGLTYREASEVLGVSADMVAKTVSRFLKKQGRRPGRGGETGPVKRVMSRVPERDPSKGTPKAGP